MHLELPGIPKNYTLHAWSQAKLFSVRGLPVQTRLDNVYANGLHTLIPFWITNETDSRLVISLNIDHPNILKVQRQNANWDAIPIQQRESYLDMIQSGPETTFMCDVAVQRGFCEVFNLVDSADQLELEPRQSAEVVLLLIANSTNCSTQFSTISANLTLSSSQIINDMYTAHVCANVCKSMLDMDPPTSRIYLDDCVLGRRCERLLQVKNMSEIPLDWSVAVVGATDSESLSGLQLLDSSLNPINGGRLAGGATKQLVLRYTPHSTGEFLCRFMVENCNDSDQRYWAFRARTTQRHKPRRIELVDDPDIDFGQCIAGKCYHREVPFRNISESPVLLRFHAEGNVSNLTMRSTVAPIQDLASETTDTTIFVPHSPEPTAPALRPLPPVLSSASTVTTLLSSPTTGRGAELRRTHGHQPAVFDEVLIKPGSTRTVVFSLEGSPSGIAATAGRFVSQSFTLFCDCSTLASSGNGNVGNNSSSSNNNNNAGSSSGNGGGSGGGDLPSDERLSLPCTLAMCTPVVRVSPALLDFGTVDVGTLKTMYLEIENVSQVEATIQCRLDSKVINCTREPVVISPLNTERIRVDIYPRRVNPRYRKQIIVRNILNRANDCIVDVRSTHVDQRRVAFHNIFYKTLIQDNEQNFIDFGPATPNSTVMRSICLRNLCHCPVTLELSSGAATEESQLLETSVYTTTTSTGVASQIAHRLLALERQAVMHSNIERFKEHTVVAQTCREVVHGHKNGHEEVCIQNHDVLLPDMFVDKTIEKGHACLLPFNKAAYTTTKNSNATSRQIEYLDAAVAAGISKRRSIPSIRIVQKTNGLPVYPTAAATKETVLSASPKHEGEGDVATAAIMRRAQQILDDIIHSLDVIPNTLFSSTQEEDEYVRRQVDLRKYLELLIESGFLQPVHRIVLAPTSDARVVVMLRPSTGVCLPHIFPDKSTMTMRFDANLYFRIVDLPSVLLPFTSAATSANTVFANTYHLPIRRFLVQASLCRTELDIGQKSINVGNMQVDEASKKYLVIHNRSELPLMYAIRKTGSIASGDIRFIANNRYGVVRGFDSRKVVFVFTPSLNGTYNERIAIDNVLDMQGGKSAMLKAVVRRPSKFYIQSLLLDFDSSSKNENTPLNAECRSSELQPLVIKNLTTKTRRLVVRPLPYTHAEAVAVGISARKNSADFNSSTLETREATLSPVFPGDVTMQFASVGLLDRDTEEKIEALEQKLKIAIRKDRPEKIDKYKSKLAKLRGTAPADDGIIDTLTSVAEDTKSNTESAGLQIPIVKRLADDTQLLITLPANSDVHVPVAVVPHVLSDTTISKVVIARGQFVVHEEKDKDNFKVVNLVASVKI